MARWIRPASVNTRNHQAAKEAIARQTETALEEVEKIYDQELSELASEATVTQFLGVLASKRVLSKLRKH